MDFAIVQVIAVSTVNPVGTERDSHFYYNYTPPDPSRSFPLRSR